MTISHKIINQLGKFIAGDDGLAPYLSGPQLVDFYNECGFDDVYESPFPSRWIYSRDKIVQANSSNRLKTILEEFVDPRRYKGNTDLVYDIVEYINSLIKYDGYLIKHNGSIYKVFNISGGIVTPESVTVINHDFVNDQIQKCFDKISTSDYAGAITNARTLVEAVLIHVIERLEGGEIKNDGNVMNLWTKAKKVLKIDLKKDETPEFIFQILSGLETSLNGLSALSNNAGDRHANKFRAKKHHAKLAVNLSMTFSDFLVEVLEQRLKSGS